MTRPVLILGWLLVVVDLIVAATLLFGRKSGDAATSAIGPGIGAVLVALGLAAAALLVWGGRGEGRTLILFVACALVATPLLFALVLSASPQKILGLIYPSMRERSRPMETAANYQYPDKVTREAAIALVLNHYDKLDDLLKATPAPDLTARDESGQTLLGLASYGALFGGDNFLEIEGLEKILKAGARPRADDGGTERSVIETAAGVTSDRGRIVLEMLFDAGLSADAPMLDGRSVLFNDYLTPQAAKLLLARGANKDVHEVRGDAGDWSPITHHVDLKNWETALALLDGGVPRDHASPVGSVLARVMQTGLPQLTDSDRANPAYLAFVGKVK